MKARFLVIVLAASAAVGGLAACKSGGPESPSPPTIRTFTFGGTVTSAGSGLVGVRVFLTGGGESRSTLTDGRGAFSFLRVSGSSFLVTPWLEDYTFDPSSYRVGSLSRSDLNFTATADSTDSLIGKTAPNFTAVDQNGQPVSLHSYLGKVILIDICADWCGSCRVEATHLEALYQAYKDQGLQIITILTSGSAAGWAAQYGLTFPVIEDKPGISAPYALGWIPINVVIDRDMIIRWHQAIDYDEALFTSIIKTYL